VVRSLADGCRRLAQISFSAEARGAAQIAAALTGPNGFRGQRLNMLNGYAAHDHRKNCRQEKKACIDFPVTTG